MLRMNVRPSPVFTPVPHFYFLLSCAQVCTLPHFLRTLLPQSSPLLLCLVLPSPSFLGLSLSIKACFSCRNSVYCFLSQLLTVSQSHTLELDTAWSSSFSARSLLGIPLCPYSCSECLWRLWLLLMTYCLTSMSKIIPISWLVTLTLVLSTSSIPTHSHFPSTLTDKPHPWISPAILRMDSCETHMPCRFVSCTPSLSWEVNGTQFYNSHVLPFSIPLNNSFSTVFKFLLELSSSPS